MQTITEINQKLLELWRKHLSGITPVYAPMQYDEPKPGGLVFVGINPSFSTKGWKSILKHSESPGLDPKTFFSWPPPQNFDIDLAHKLEAIAQERYPFYAPHRELSEGLNLHYTHFDLFAYRETAQAKMRTLALSGDNDIDLTEFGNEQFKIFEALLVLARPLAVIVINALASQIYLKKRSPSFDPSVGYYRDKTCEHSFPVFFSGMLTGVRALDRFSKNRLFWQISKALGKDWPADKALKNCQCHQREKNEPQTVNSTP